MKKALLAGLAATAMMIGMSPGSSSASLFSTWSSSDATALVQAILGTGATLVPGSATLVTDAPVEPPTEVSDGYTGYHSGFFSGAQSLFGEAGNGNSTGIVLSTIDLIRIGAFNTCEGMSTIPGSYSRLSFLFETTGGDLSLNYVFGSEEYGNTPTANDYISFLLDGTEIALVPGSNDGVSVDNINSATNAHYYRDNSTGALGTEFDGLTTVLTASFQGLSAGTHHMELFITDALNWCNGSGVFIQEGSLNVAAVPEPATMALFGAGLIGLAATGRRKTGV